MVGFDGVKSIAPDPTTEAALWLAFDRSFIYQTYLARIRMRCLWESMGIKVGSSFDLNDQRLNFSLKQQSSASSLFFFDNISVDCSSLRTRPVIRH